MGRTGSIRKRHNASFKSEVAIEAVKETQTLNEIANRFQVHPTQVSDWKRMLQENAPAIFTRHSVKKGNNEASSALVDKLYEEIGRLKFELDWLKKKTDRIA